MDGTILGKKYDIINGEGGGKLTPATADTLGGIMVGNGLSITEEGVLSADEQELEPATGATLGGVIVGSGLSVTEEGVLSANSQAWNYSTDEVNTGQKWIDGSDIYCKVYNNVQLSNGTDVVVDANFGSDKNIVKIDGVGSYLTGDVKTSIMLSNYLAGGDKAVPKVTGGTLLVEVRDNWSVWTCHFIVYYTKTEA